MQGVTSLVQINDSIQETKLLLSGLSCNNTKTKKKKKKTECNGRI